MTAYLDHAATTPVRPEVAEAYSRELGRIGNPSALHAAGRAARARVEEAREQLAAAVEAEPAEVLFTSGGTEADNLAVKGAYWARRAADPARTAVAVSAIEHHAVLEAASWLGEHDGAEVIELPVTPAGALEPAGVEAAFGRTDLALASVMWANNETGVIQPVAELAARAHRAGVPLHSDAVQALGKIPVRFSSSGVDALSLTGHKIGAPVGTGALIARRDFAMTPVEHGGGQERGVRSGTLSVAEASALALAVELAVAAQQAEAQRLAVMRDRLLAAAALIEGVQVTGPAEGRGSAEWLPSHAHLTVAGADADALLASLDMAGIAASSGAACQSGVQQPSHVLTAMGYQGEQARAAVRLSLGHTSTEEDVTAALAVLEQAVTAARRVYDAGRGSARRAAGTSRKPVEQGSH